MSNQATHHIRYSAMTDAQKKEYDKKFSVEIKKKKFDDQLTELEATIERRSKRIIVQKEKIKEKESSVRNYEEILCKKMSDNANDFIKKELYVARKSLSDLKNNLVELEKSSDLAHHELRKFFDTTFGKPDRITQKLYNGYIITVRHYGNYAASEWKKEKSYI